MLFRFLLTGVLVWTAAAGRVQNYTSEEKSGDNACKFTGLVFFYKIIHISRKKCLLC